jgi:hypothetical protein
MKRTLSSGDIPPASRSGVEIEFPRSWDDRKSELLGSEGNGCWKQVEDTKSVLACGCVDGKAYLSDNKTIFEIDTRTREIMRTMDIGHPGDIVVRMLAFKLSRTVLVICERNWYALDVSNWTLVHIKRPNEPEPLRFVGNEYDQGRIAVLYHRPLPGNDAHVTYIELWSLTTGELESVTRYLDGGESREMYDIVCGAGRVFRIGVRHRLCVFDNVEKGTDGVIANHETHPRLRQHARQLYEFIGDLSWIGKHLAYSISGASVKPSVVLLDPVTFETVAVIVLQYPVSIIGATPDGRFIVMSTTYDICIYDVSSRAFVRKATITNADHATFEEDLQCITVMKNDCLFPFPEIHRVSMAPLVIEANGFRLYADGFVVDASVDVVSHPPFDETRPMDRRLPERKPAPGPAPICITDADVGVWTEAIEAVVANRSLPLGSRAILGDNVILSRRFALLQTILFHARGADQSTGLWIPREIIQDIAKYTF